jgi:DNA-binding transcriptional MocR family regulator
MSSHGSRLDHIEPFYVMECAKAAIEIARSPACDPAARRRADDLPEHRRARLHRRRRRGAGSRRAMPSATAARQYTARHRACPRCASASPPGTAAFGLDGDPARIVITAGASAALQLACLALFEPATRC